MTSSMNPETIEKLKEVFAPVAKKIGQGAQFGWEVVMKQQYVIVFGDLISIIVSAVGIFGGYKLWQKGIEVKKEDNYGMYEGWFVVGTILMVLGAIIIPVSIYDAIAHLVNPEYYAIEFFMNLAK